MKANGTKRKIFNDAVDLLAGAEEVSAPENGIRMLPIDSIRPFRKHPFRLYEGERLEDMVESIREHGVLNPVIVWQEGDGYEMLAGHNRQVAGRLAGLTEIPAIVKTDLTEEDAYVYVIETNVIQRGFAELSYLSEKEQEVVSGLAEQGRIKLDAKTAKCVRGMAGNVTEEAVLGALDGGKGKKAAAGRSVRLPAEVYERYFGSVKPADVAGIVEDALAAWFGKGGVADVPGGRDREAG